MPRGTQGPLEGGSRFRIRGCHPLWPTFPGRSANASLPSFNQAMAPHSAEPSPDYCGPTTPRSPRGSRGLGCSGFARHYSRNHGCFLFLRVLRWFTSPGSPPAPMDSGQDEPCSHGPGSPIRRSPDHSLLAAPRGLSQLATSFIACLRLGIHTHALSILAVRLTLDGESLRRSFRLPVVTRRYPNCQRSTGAQKPRPLLGPAPLGSSSGTAQLVGLGRLELPTSPLSGVRSNHLSYRPIRPAWWS